MTIHGRDGALLTALCAAFALALSGSALAAHDLKIYKVERQVDLVSDFTTVDLKCDTGDYAVDGMWRIEHGDQDDDDLFPQAIGRAVDVLAAFPKADTGSPAADSIYQFDFYKNVIGRAQAKVYATCVGARSYSADGHSHPLVYTKAAAAPFVAGIAPAQTPVYAQSNICPAGTFVAGTGFKVNFTPDADGDPAPYVGRMERSTLFDSSLRGWKWSFSSGPSVDYYAHCLAKKVTPAGGEKHKIIYRYQGQGSTSSPLSTSIGNGVSTKRISCASHYKAVVAGFEIVGGPGSAPDPGTGGSSPAYWYLGMDPNPKSRDFRFLNTSSPFAAGTVELVAVCLNYRTT